MAILNFVATTTKLLVNVKPKDDTIVLLGNLRLARRESVKLGSGEEFEKLEGVLRVVKQEDDLIQTGNPIGWLSYSEEMSNDIVHLKASYSLAINMPKERFEALVTASKRRAPSLISIETEGMKYDWQPDGSGKLWENKTSPVIPVTSVYFITPLVGGDVLDFMDDRPTDDEVPPTRAQLNTVLAALNNLRGLFHWLLILVAIILEIVKFLVEIFLSDSCLNSSRCRL